MSNGNDTNDAEDFSFAAEVIMDMPPFDDPVPVVFRSTRAEIVTARNTILRAASGESADLETAAAMLDTVLKSLCPHDPASRHTALDAAGRILTTCSACGVSWFEHGDDAAGALEAVYVAHETRRAAYMDALGTRLEARRHAHGHAYVTPREGAWLAENGLYQPGHTTHRYSTPGEDLSDATQAATSDETEG